jgi:hypothetical protein
MLSTLEQHMQTFLPLAKELMMDVSLRTELSFEDNNTQVAFTIFSLAYGMGSRDMILEAFK